MANQNRHELLEHLSVSEAIHRAIKMQLKKHIQTKPKARNYNNDFLYFKAYNEWENIKEALEYQLHLSITHLN